MRGSVNKNVMTLTSTLHSSSPWAEASAISPTTRALSASPPAMLLNNGLDAHAYQALSRSQRVAE